MIIIKKGFEEGKRQNLVFFCDSVEEFCIICLYFFGKEIWFVFGGHRVKFFELNKEKLELL